MYFKRDPLGNNNGYFPLYGSWNWRETPILGTSRKQGRSPGVIEIGSARVRQLGGRLGSSERMRRRWR